MCVDGPAGSGKTTLAGQLAAAGPADRPAPGLVHLDDLYAGWSGLPRVPGQLAELLAPLAAGRESAYRRFDWVADRYAETVPVPPTDLLVVEGVGAGSAPPELVTLLVWVEAPEDLRVRRGLARDGVEAEPHWRAWLVEEAAHFAAYDTRARADVLVDGTGSRRIVLSGRTGSGRSPRTGP